MKKFFSKSLAIILSLSICFVFTPAANAISSGLTDYQKYQELVEDGIIGNDVSYEMWCEVTERSMENMQQLVSSGQFELVYSGPTYAAANITLYSGDIVLTHSSSTAGNGIIGHAGIAITSDDVLHIRDHNSTNIETSSWSSWINDYGLTQTQVFRCSDVSRRANAATWAVNNYKDKTVTYQINTDLYSTSTTYCSKIVWQAYYFGAGSYSTDWPMLNLVMPYDLPLLVHNVSEISVY